MNRLATDSFRAQNLKLSLRANAPLLIAILSSLAWIGGCAGVVNGKSSAQPTPSGSYSVSGTISPTAGGNGATVTLSGSASATTTANSSGNYTFTGLANGSYTVSASRTGYTFSPSPQTATVNGANMTAINFTATPQTAQTYSIAGIISPAAGGSGTTVSLGGASSATTTTNASGDYSFTGLANGTYAVVPSHSGYTFSPSTQGATVNGANVTAINFTASPAPTYSISGTITPAAGGSGAQVTLGGAASATVVTNSSGNYTFTGLTNGAYSVLPANTGYTFLPASQNVTINAANVPAVNFTANQAVQHSVALTWSATPSIASGYNVYRSTVSGSAYAKINSGVIANLAYKDATVTNGVTYFYVVTAVDASLNESVYSNELQMNIP